MNIFFFFFCSQHLLQLFNNFTPYTQPYFQEAHWEFVGKFLSSIWLRSCKPWVCIVNDLLSSFPFLSGVRVTPSLVLYVCFVDRYLSFCTFSFGHCVFCPASIYGLWIPLWYLQTLLNILLYFHCLVFLNWYLFYIL